MHPVDRYKHYVFDLVEVVTPGHHRQRQQQNTGNYAAEHRSCKPESFAMETEQYEQAV
jgi:hypothetical protein